MIWHSEPLDKILRELDTDPATGLSEEQASLRRTALRKQRSSKKGRRFFLQRCRVRLHNPFLLLLFIALVVYLAFSIIQTIQGGDAELSSAVRLTLSLMAVNLLILVGGAGMDARAAAYLAGRRDISSGVRVIRDGVERTISSEEKAPGDILLLKAGDLIPADCRLLDGTSLLCDESPLTRDEQPVEKNSEAVPEAITPLNKRENMLYAGCLLLRGECRAVAVETGEDTERSRLASLNSQGDAVPFKEHLKKWDRIGRFLILAAGILLLAIGLLFSATLPELLFTILSAAAALSSAGLPFLSLVFLSRGIRRMERDGVILRRLAAVSDLNRVNLLATDKSGILTEDRLSVIRLFAGNQLIKADRNRRLPEAALALLRLSLLCSGGQPNAADDALLACGKRNGFSRKILEQEHPQLVELPFEAHHKRMATVHLVNGRPLVIVKGAPETVFPLCTASDTRAALLTAEEMEQQGLQVLAVGYRFLEEAPTDLRGGEWESNLTLAGLIGMADAPRPGTAEAVRLFRRAGIRVVMFTGNPPAAAEAAGSQLGILSSPEETVVTSENLREQDAREGRVFSRLSLEDKRNLLDIWNAQGNHVALAGATSADISLFQKAEVKCSPSFGADAVKDAADLIWQDGRFASLAGAVRESRGIADNLRRGAGYLFSCGGGILLSLLLGLLLSGSLVFDSLALAVSGLAISALLSLLFGGRRADSSVMLPRSHRFPLMPSLVGAASFAAAVLLSNPAGNTPATVTLWFSLLTTALTQRSGTFLIRSFRWREAVTLGVFLLLAALPVALPAVFTAVGWYPLSLSEAAAAAAWSLLPLAAGEAVKGILCLTRRNSSHKKHS